MLRPSYAQVISELGIFMRANYIESADHGLNKEELGLYPRTHPRRGEVDRAETQTRSIPSHHIGVDVLTPSSEPYGIYNLSNENAGV